MNLASLPSPALAEGPSLGVALELWTVVPFALLLLAIAILPLVAAHWWERNANKGKVAALFALPVAAYLVFHHGEAGFHDLVEKGEEYVSFLALLVALYVVSGGIYIKGSLSGTPLVNTAILGLGAVIANLIGTTGASVLLIRPYLRANAKRHKKVHLVVFFIFVVSNCGGLLTPLGDPPLFLGFLKGVPFAWTLQLWKEWLLVNGVLLFVFNVWDQVVLNAEELKYKGSQLAEVQQHAKFGVEGGHNFLFLAGVVAVIVGSGAGLWNDGRPWHFGVQESAMVGLAGWSYATTKATVRHHNRFTFGPIVEVAVLFAGIFATMGPALLILNAWSQGQRDVFGASFTLSEPWQFFWASGMLSSFLDNAPTYLAFSATAAGLEHIPLEGAFLGELIARGGKTELLLAAVSCGAVFMGANTYIGNGPNFMVKSIAEENGVEMPSFFGYMAYSVAILIPLFAIVTLVFFL
jgi:Na+/H+ antiporter NhaD/arsenite permease-like protein